MKVKGLLYEIKYDGVIIKYKPKKLASPLLKFFGIYPEKCEFPISYILNYRTKNFLGLRVLSVYVNSGRHGLTVPSPKKIGRFLFWRNKRFLEEQLLAAFDSVILQNVSGTNIGLSNIKKNALLAYYQGLNNIGLMRHKAMLQPSSQYQQFLSIYTKDKGEIKVGVVTDTSRAKRA